jgi:hypothetical protein
MTVTAKKCPRCAVEVDWGSNPYRPFCCERCKTADLAAWADERYRIPGDKTKDGETSYNNDKINPEES